MKYFRMNIIFDDLKTPFLLDISSLIYDIELLYDFCLIVYSDDYADYRISNYFYYRYGRHTRREHKVRALKIIKESPLTLEVLIPLIFGFCAALWAFVQAFEKISNRKLNRKKLKLEIERLERENRIKLYDEEKARTEMEIKIRQKEAYRIFFNLLERLEKNPHVMKEISLLPYEEETNNNEFTISE